MNRIRIFVDKEAKATVSAMLAVGRPLYYEDQSIPRRHRAYYRGVGEEGECESVWCTIYHDY